LWSPYRHDGSAVGDGVGEFGADQCGVDEGLDPFGNSLPDSLGGARPAIQEHAGAEGPESFVVGGRRHRDDP
jgi:hypothetical protein